MNHYQTLGVSVDADPVVVRAAYRALSQRYHPDKAPPANREAANQRMAQVNEAFSVLGDHSSRARYDAGLNNDARADEPGRSGVDLRRVSALAIRGVIFVGVMAMVAWIAAMLGVEDKSWASRSWEFISGGFTRPSRFIFHWPTIIFIVLIGLAVANKLSLFVAHRLRRGQSDDRP